MASSAVPTGSIPGLSSPSSKLTPVAQNKCTRSLPLPGYYTGVPLHLLQVAQLQQQQTRYQTIRKNGRDPLQAVVDSNSSTNTTNGIHSTTSNNSHIPSTLLRGGAPSGLILGNSGITQTINGSIPILDYLSIKQNLDDTRNSPTAAILSPDYQKHVNLVHEKQRLHDESVAMVAKWNNTIAGQRKTRLAAQNAKTRAAEDLRQQMDRDWEQVKAAERQAMVERAKKLQYLDDARVRQLNSQALITQVLKERKHQIEQKKVEKALEQERTQEELTEELNRLKEADREALELQSRVKQMMLETAATNRQFSETKRLEQENEKQELRDWFAHANEKAAEELKEMSIQRTQQKLDDTKELVAMLNWAVTDKQIKEQSKVKEDSELERINYEITMIKDSIARKRKETEAAIIRARIARNEYVASLQVPIQESFQKERDEFLTKLEHAHDGEEEKRLQIETEKRHNDTQACLEAMKKSITEREHQRMMERMEAIQVRKRNEEIARLALQSASKRKERNKRIQKMFGDTYRKEMNDHALRAHIGIQERKKEYLQTIDTELQRDLEFHNYANKLIADLKSINNDPTLVVKKYEEMERDNKTSSNYH